ncbi:SpoIIE family protein phosphatase [Pseudaquabacterium rugosum]|uniref:SpoIIE family protein phosphatase n=1 Tax=Pseudaquabacterium rugosum TaxID=2984194 RepID=A0ABU9B633_9BURK
MASLRCGRSAMAAPGEHACGDRTGCWHDRHGGTWLAIIDGLGHGPLAALAADTALAALAPAITDARAGPPQPRQLLEDLHGPLAGTRGAAIGLACVRGDQLHHAGIGNTRAGVLRDGRLHGLPSAYGIVGAPTPVRGHAMPPVGTPAFTLCAGDWLLLYSDGLPERLPLPVVPAAWRQDPLRLCEHLLATARQPRDDAAVIAAWVEAV